jgi:hypothetical protein
MRGRCAARADFWETSRPDLDARLLQGITSIPIRMQKVRSTNYKSVGKNLLRGYVGTATNRISKGLRDDQRGPIVIAKNQISMSLLSRRRRRSTSCDPENYGRKGTLAASGQLTAAPPRSKRVGALFVAPQADFRIWLQHLLTLAARQALPTTFSSGDYVRTGGLMSYGADQIDSYRQAGVYAGRILKGEKPTDLPVMLPSKFEFTINLKTAKTLGLEIPPGVIAIADEVIE